MIKCDFDMCVSNEDGVCTREDIVLKVVETKEGEALVCKCFDSY
jgi:hypothetical protein